MNARDFDYVEGRLLVPAPNLGDAIDRLRTMGLDEIANDATDSLQRFTDECREHRRKLTDIFNAEARARG